MSDTKKKRRLRFVLLVAVPLLAALAASAFYLEGGRTVDTDDAYVKADKVPLSAQVPGTVAEVMVRENQQVAAGEPLFRLDPTPFKVAVARAEAKLAQARTDLMALRASYREKEAEIEIARTRLGFAEKNKGRQLDLASRSFISASRLDEANQEAALARQQLSALEQDLLRIGAALGGGIDSEIRSHPSYLSAQAELEEAKLNLSRIEVRAPLPGTVSAPPKIGQYLATGSTAMALVGDGSLWVEANFPETDLTHVRPGQYAFVSIDAYPGFRWRGTVESLSPATSSEFSLLPAQNATGNWVKIAQRVPVRIRLEPAGGPQLRAGLSTTVEIETGHRRSLLGLSL